MNARDWKKIVRLAVGLFMAMVVLASAAGSPDSGIPESDVGTHLLVVYGFCFQPDEVTLVPDGHTVAILNVRTGVEVHGMIGEVESGKYTAIFFDPDDVVAEAGDVLQMWIQNESPLDPTVYELSQPEVDEMYTRIDLRATIVDAESLNWGSFKSIFR